MRNGTHQSVIRKIVFAAAVVLHLLLFDAVTKEIAAARLRGAMVSVIPNFFNLAYVENRGCAWGLFQGQVWPLAVFGLVALGAILIFRRRIFPLDTTGWRHFVAISSERLLYAGIIGNLIDRFFRGYVIDFLDFHWYDSYHFPCFNVADTYISVAAGLMILLSFFDQKKAENVGA